MYCIVVRGPSRSGANHLSSSGNTIWERESIRFLSLEVDRAAGTVGGMDPLRRWAFRSGLVCIEAHTKAEGRRGNRSERLQGFLGGPVNSAKQPQAEIGF